MNGFPAGARVCEASLALASGISQTSVENSLFTRYESEVGPETRNNGSLNCSRLRRVTQDSWNRPKTIKILSRLNEIGRDGADMVNEVRESDCERPASLMAEDSPEYVLPLINQQASVRYKKGKDIVLVVNGGGGRVLEEADVYGWVIIRKMTYALVRAQEELLACQWLDIIMNMYKVPL